MYEYTVPQEFNQDDRIGNFTMPQAMILGASVLLLLMMFAMGVHIYLILALLPLLAAFTIFLMYKKVYNIPIYEFGLVYFTYKATPKLFIYRKENLRDEFLDMETRLLLIEDGE